MELMALLVSLDRQVHLVRGDTLDQRALMDPRYEHLLSD